MSVNAAASDRLPWLADEPAPRRQHPPRGRSLLPGASAAMLLVVGAGFWLGLQRAKTTRLLRQEQAKTTITMRLPPPDHALATDLQAAHDHQAPPQPEVRLSRSKPVSVAPEVRHALARLKKPRSRRTSHVLASASRTVHHKASTQAAAAPQLASPPRRSFVRGKIWNPMVAGAAAGPLVQVGAFGSVTQAKRGWRFMAQAYPAMAHLPALVTATHNSAGRVYYRFRVRTTSQAHSEVLCQRMEKIRLSCAVVGLPRKTKVER